ncbi:MAG: hypothetical protein Q9160_005129 [Pyrenula sp. 1 TL-2023]
MPLSGSIDGSAAQDYQENGRLYPGFRRGLYLQPCDTKEMERLDVVHHLLYHARHKSWLNAPFEQQPPTPYDRTRVLDLGAGTGAWCDSMAATGYSEAEFVGIDIAGMGPPRTYPNVELRWPIDYESPWSLGENSWDLIHLQLGCGCVSNWPKLYDKVYKHLRPGSWFEQVEIDYKPWCEGPDGNTAPYPPQGKLMSWYLYMVEATRSVNKSIAYNENTDDMLRAAGFTNVNEYIYKLPLNSWPGDAHNKDVGRWMSIILTDQNNCGLEGLSLATFFRVNQWPVDHIRRFLDETAREVKDKRNHAFMQLRVVWAQRPTSNDPRHPP